MRTWVGSIKLLALAGLGMAGVGLSAEAAEPPEWSVLEQCVRDEMEKSNTPGAALAIIQGDRVIYARGFGVANVETGERVLPETLFRLASTTKMFTAAAALRAVEEGKLTLDSPISKSVSGLAPEIGEVTLHQLLSHTAGFSDGGEMDGPHDDAALGAEVRSWKNERAFIPPGRIFSYSNFGYALAGLATGEATGKPFADAVRDLVLRPLGMRRSTFRPTETVTYPFSQGHHPGESGKPEVVRPYLDHAGTWPAGCLNSSVDELSRFMIAFLNEGKLEGRQVLSRSLIEKMSQPHAAIPSSEYGERYGYGLVHSTYRGTPMLAHGGSRVGFGAELRMFPRQRVGVVLLTNRSGFALHGSVARASEMVLELKDERTTPVAVPELSEAQLTAYTGTFVHPPMKSVIELRDGKLIVREQGEEMELKPYAPHRFKAREHGMFWYTFVMGTDGKAAYIHRGHRAMRRVEPATPAAQ